MEMKNNSWEYKSLNEMGTVARGRSQHRPRNDSCLYGGKYPFIQTGDVKDSGLYIERYSQTYNDLGLAQSKLWPLDTLCITIAANIADTSILSFEACFPDSILGFTADEEKSDVHFVKYCFDLLQKNIKKMSGGSTQDNLSLDKLEKIQFRFPNLQTQQKIAAVLSSLDDKIALNNRINTKLEKMAKRLYDYWFVQFDFPNEDGKPYKSSGGKMVYNGQLKHEIPAGWKVKSINEISISAKGVGYTANDEKQITDENVVLILRGNNISNNHIIYDSNTVYVDSGFIKAEQKIKKYDIIITMSSGSKAHVGKSAMFLFDSPHSYGAFCNKIAPNSDCQFFIENYLHSDIFLKYIHQSCSGTGINNLTNEHFDNAIFPFPNDNLIEIFNTKVENIYSERAIVEQENQKLTVLRDKLLPLLMNGQVEVR